MQKIPSYACGAGAATCASRSPGARAPMSICAWQTPSASTATQQTGGCPARCCRAKSACPATGSQTWISLPARGPTRRRTTPWCGMATAWEWTPWRTLGQSHRAETQRPLRRSTWHSPSCAAGRGAGEGGGRGAGAAAGVPAAAALHHGASASSAPTGVGAGLAGPTAGAGHPHISSATSRSGRGLEDATASSPDSSPPSAEGGTAGRSGTRQSVRATPAHAGVAVTKRSDQHLQHHWLCV